jgi:hypothetical protein
VSSNNRLDRATPSGTTTALHYKAVAHLPSPVKNSCAALTAGPIMSTRQLHLFLHHPAVGKIATPRHQSRYSCQISAARGTPRAIASAISTPKLLQATRDTHLIGRFIVTGQRVEQPGGK